MCGIVGYIGKKQASPILLKGLLNLEYRGYDSAGISTIEKDTLSVLKDKGRVKNLENLSEFDSLKGTIGIAHTRWATHGKPSITNSHPHLDNSKTFSVVHNGIIENFNELRKFLTYIGFNFKAETHTEVIPNLISYYYHENQCKDISAFLVRAEFIKRTSENDKKLMTKIEGQIDELKDLENEVKVQRKAVADKRAVHEKERAELLGSQNDLKSSVNILETKQQDLGAKKTEAGLLLEKLDKDSAAYKEQIAQIENDMNSIEALIQQYSSSGSATLPEIDIPTGGTVEDGLFEPNSKGWLWPVKAKGMQVCSPYGMRWHPVYGGYRMHTGVDIDSSLGNAYVRRKPIVASKAGVVTYSGWNGGYGKCVIVDHGQGISTLYAHCDELTVNSGQTVAQGQTIALLGTTGTSTGEHLHFEVRVNGSHTNPMNYISL